MKLRTYVGTAGARLRRAACWFRVSDARGERLPHVLTRRERGVWKRQASGQRVRDARQPPAAFAVQENDELRPFIGAPEMDAADLKGLMELVQARLR